MFLDHVLVLVFADDPSLHSVPLPPNLKAKLAQSDVTSHSTEHSSAVETAVLSPRCIFAEIVNPATGP